MEEGSVRKESGEYDISLFNASSRIYCQLLWSCECHYDELRSLMWDAHSLLAFRKIGIEIPFTWFIPNDSKRSGNLTCTRQIPLPATMSWFHSTGSVILGRRISECELWKSVAFILLLFTLVFFCLLMFTFVYPNRYSFRFWMWIMEIRCLCFTFVLICFFCLPLFTLVYKEKSVFL